MKRSSNTNAAATRPILDNIMKKTDAVKIVKTTTEKLRVKAKAELSNPKQRAAAESFLEQMRDALIDGFQQPDVALWQATGIHG